MNKIALTVMTAVLAACASTMPPTFVFDNSRQFSLSKRDVWDQLVGQFAMRNIPIDTIEYDSGLISASTGIGLFFADVQAPVIRDYYVCETNPMFVPTSTMATFSVQVVADEEQLTTVTINLGITQPGYITLNRAPVVGTCSSTGFIETEWLNLIGSATLTDVEDSN